MNRVKSIWEKMMTAAVKMEEKMGFEVTGSITGNSFVPKRMKEYVPFGHFSDIRAIIESGIFAPIYISGLSGNGKTLMCEQVCAILSRECVMVSFTEETDETDLIGHYDLINGETVWTDGPVITAMKRGAVLVLDEVDLGMFKIMCLQQVLAGNPVLIKKTGEMVYPAPGFMVIATANTKGRGSFDTRFVGNNILNEAFLDRFSFTIEQDYPSQATEVSILKKMFEHYGVTNYGNFADVLVKWSGLTREAFNDHAIEDLISTRRLVHIVKAYAIFRDRTKAVKICLSRFDESVAKSFLDSYNKVVDETKENNDEETEAESKVTKTPDPFDWD